MAPCVLIGQVSVSPTYSTLTPTISEFFIDMYICIYMHMLYNEPLDDAGDSEKYGEMVEAGRDYNLYITKMILFIKHLGTTGKIS